MNSGSRFDLRRLKVYKGKPSGKIDAWHLHHSRAEWEGHLYTDKEDRVCAVTPTGDLVWLVVFSNSVLNHSAFYIGLDYSDKTRKALSRVLKKEIK